MLYCIRVLLKVIYLPQLDFKPVNFLWVCCLLIDASSSWFQNFRKPLHASCYCSVWTTVFYPRIFGMFSKIAVFFRSNFLRTADQCLDLVFVFTLTVLSLTCYLLFLGPFRAPRLLSTLCTAFYALIGMLLRGSKTVEKREFLQDFNFQLLFTVILYN